MEVLEYGNNNNRAPAPAGAAGAVCVLSVLVELNSAQGSTFEKSTDGMGY